MRSLTPKKLDLAEYTSPGFHQAEFDGYFVD